MHLLPLQNNGDKINSMLEQVLKKMGLSEKTAKVYAISFEFGPQTVQQMAQKLGIPRPTVYSQIESLIKLGLMSKIEKGGKVYFAAESPENLERLLKKKVGEIQSLSLEFKKNLPRLKRMFLTSEEKPKIRFFEGKEGLLTMIKDFKRSKFDSVEEFVPIDEAFNMMPPADQDFRQKLAKKFKKIPMRIIYTSKDGPILKAKEGNKERKFVTREKFPHSGSLTIYGKKVALMSENADLIGIIIESRGISDTLRTLFDFAWESIKKEK